MEKLSHLTGVLAAVSGLEARWSGLHAECRDKIRFLLELLADAEAPQSQAEGFMLSTSRLGFAGSRARSSDVTSTFSLLFLSPQEDV